MTAIETGQLIGQFVTLLGTVAAILIAVFNKKARTPADDQARQAFAYQVIKERLDEANADRKVLSDTVNFLRDQARARDEQDANDFEREQKREELTRDLNKRINDLNGRIHAYEARLERLAEKVRNGHTITLVDIYGERTAHEATALVDADIRE
jgi:small-conductance mechanosensitive channel